jgi:hypothetical protein
MKASDLIGSNDEGLMWVKVFLKDGNANGQKTDQMIPIRWVKVAKENAPSLWTDQQFLKIDNIDDDNVEENRRNEMETILSNAREPESTKDGSLEESIALAVERQSGSFIFRSQSPVTEGTDCWIHVSRASCDNLTRANSNCEEPERPLSVWDDGGDPEIPETCAVCLERPVDMQLLPCAHQQFCRTCILESICCWSRYRPHILVVGNIERKELVRKHI